jgi:acyl-CoA reductase-like NAD-dependent aldehyde dehydrogenase
MTNRRLSVLKTYKVYIGGQFPRTESGRTYPLNNQRGKHIAHVCLCSRKDIRDAVVSARNAWGSWSKRAPFNRGQILYRMAEMLEGRKAQFVEEMQQMGLSKATAEKEVAQSVDRLIYYSGWCDKYQQVFSTVNPVASSHFNFSVLEPVGVVSVFAPTESPLLGLVSLIAPIIAGGNTCVVLSSETSPLSAITLAEVLNSSDLPGGVVNVLTGKRKELIAHMADHMDVNAVCITSMINSDIKLIQEKATGNIKRVRCYDNTRWDNDIHQGPHLIQDFQEVKTTWHPIEQIGGAKAGY